jgi:hypothetical protein
VEGAGFNPYLACKGFNPLRSSSIPVGLGITERCLMRKHKHCNIITISMWFS